MDARCTDTNHHSDSLVHALTASLESSAYDSPALSVGESMRHLSRVMGMMGLAVSVAACSTAGQSSGGLGESASQTVRDHPQTAAGAGVGAAGGAVVGGLAGGTKGAVIGGLLGAL